MKTLVIFSLAVITFFSCSKKAEEDHVHPEYASINAVIGSNTIIDVGNWAVETDDGTNFSYYSEYNYPAITQDVIDKGAVLVYMRENATEPWYALPASYSDDTYSSLSFTYGFTVGQLTISLDGFSDAGSPGLAGLTFLDEMDVRVVVLNSTARIAGIDWNDYEAVQQALETNE